MPEILQDILTALLLAPVAYVSTNVDNLLVLGALAQGSCAEKTIRGGFIIASAAVLFLSLSFVVLGYFVPPSAIGYLGVVPIALGVRQLLANVLDASTHTYDGVTIPAVSMVLIANSSDTIAVFGPLFAESQLAVLITLAAGFVVAASGWLLLALQVHMSIGRSATLATLSRRASPIIMIGIGSYVLMNTGTDLV
jgi:cadmium resistance protein CadD (predicted permease)